MSAEVSQSTRRRFRLPRLPGYGASVGHLLGLVLSFGLAAYAGKRMLAFMPWGYVVWFVGAILLHDLVLFPVYSAADAVLRRGTGRIVGGPRVPLVNYIRIPALISGLLLLVWFPLIFRQVDDRELLTALPDDAYLGRWVAITVVVFAISAAAYVVRLLRRSPNARGPQNAE